MESKKGKEVEYEVYWDLWFWLTRAGYKEHRKYPGWKGFLPFYKIDCPVHGVLYDYPHGFRQIVSCPVCRK